MNFILDIVFNPDSIRKELQESVHQLFSSSSIESARHVHSMESKFLKWLEVKRRCGKWVFFSAGGVWMTT